MKQVVEQFYTTDGLGAMLWKKIYAMCYAYRYKKLFRNKPFIWFLVHPSDNAEDETTYYDLLYKFNHLLYNPWENIDFNSFDWELCPDVGQGAEVHPGFADHYDFLLEAPVFNKQPLTDNSNIVIHMRRGNAVEQNPRFTGELIYVNILKQIDNVAKELGIDNPQVIILTDAPDQNSFYTPSKKDMKQYKMWHQPWLDKNEHDQWKLTTVNWDLLRSVYPKIIFKNKLNTYEAFILMLNAKLLIPAYSAFSQCAGLLTHNKVLYWPSKEGMDRQMNLFKNSVGKIDAEGNIKLN